MRAARLFARTRHTIVIVCAVCAISLIVAIVGALSVRFTAQSRITIPAALILPIVPAVLIGATHLNRPTLRRELDATRHLWRWRVGQVVVLTIFASAVMGVSSWQVLHDGSSGFAVARNVLGFVGLALVGSALVGNVLSWVVPMTWLLLPGFLFDSLDQDHVGVMTFFAQPDRNLGAAVFAVAVLSVGCLWAGLARSTWGLVGQVLGRL